jgi:5-methylcytosine-specific restriction endonuclease McrA
VPTASLRPCSVCHVVGCVAHRRPSHDYRVYRTARWRAFREGLLAERVDCEDCVTQGQRTVAVELHHVIKRGKEPGLTFEPTNIKVLCRPCHRRRTNRGE